ncbi:tripartite tricarboxylate transporter TctB family protein [Streptomonospora wellingtoniae]|uniref:Tripartite tricarboxylate transporter TctB family protein n=1 Tax=Streptomonospora wellingtoniae TaxID=3075544 RepID=A0ABU2KN61_9ACTN|nr:tripartite tricarboxylate transporter TctB family protein [Streptomonospora sp. DSM 45055]MDT0300700.1 tripartite tricarboxylate transporter TctB family protein [Streptomonospora sp. DSM 45055]
MAGTPTSRVRLPFQRASAERTGGDPSGRGPSRAQPEAGGSGPSASPRRLRVSGETLFYLLVGAVLTGYTVMAFGMEWQTTAGRVGPGLFPRIIGVLGVAACAICTVQSVLRRRPEGADEESEQEQAAGEQAADGEPGAAGGGQARRRHPWAVVALCAILVAFVTVLVPVGAVVTGSVALIAALLVCDRSHPVRSVVIGAVFPVALYAVFVFGLNAPLPAGILPLY